MALFHRALFLGETFVHRDLRTYSRPLLSIVAPLARASHGWPLWNPLVGSGQPFLGSPAHPLAHPLTALFFVLPFEWAFRLQVMLPPLLGAAAMAFLLRTLGRSRLAAVFGALAWGFGGLVLGMTDVLPICHALVPVPAALGFAVRLARAPSRRAVAGLALCVGGVLLAGEPVAALVLAILLPAAFVAGLPRGARWSGAAARALASLGLAAAIGAATILPGLWHLRRTDRARGLPAETAGLWSFPPQRLLELASPLAGLRLPQDDPGRLAALYPGRGYPYFRSLYGGLAPFVLACAALACARRRLWPWLAAGVLGLLLALGTHAPFWGWLRGLPLLHAVRFPEKFVVVPLLAFVVFAARGLDLLATRRPRLAAAVVVATAADLFVSGRGLVGTAPVASVARPPSYLASALRPPLSGPLFWNATPEAASRLPEWEVDFPPVPAQWRIATALSVDFAQTELRWSVAATRRFYLAVRDEPALLGPLLARRGVAAVVHDAPPGASSPVLLARLADPRPFAFFAERSAFVAGEEGWSREVRRLGPLAARTVCLDERDRARAPERPSPGTITGARRWPDRLLLDAKVDGPEPALLAVNQTWDATWRARVDGKPAELLVADLSLSALAVPPGAHRVELFQRNDAVTAGLVVSVLGLLAAGALFARRPRLQRG